jgi:ubiquinone/menaquinone biosynthesis C-methylase UbiE
MKDTNDALRENVRQKYAAIARAGGDCCGPSRCSIGQRAETGFSMIGNAYDGVSGYMAEADLGLGCGLPVEHAGLAPGQTVLDLGAGAGLDAFVARREVGAEGHVIGVDMTPEMVSKARDNAAKAGYENVDFRLGEIEHLPVRSDSVDVVISNCVLNLVPDKPRAFAEIHRVLKPGGHFCISDIVSSNRLPDWVQGIADAYAGCVSGAVPREDYMRIISEAGFDQVVIRTQRRIDVPAELIAGALSAQQREMVERMDLHVMSITVTARKAES